MNILLPNLQILSLSIVFDHCVSLFFSPKNVTFSVLHLTFHFPTSLGDTVCVVAYYDR
jgi:hypothetical protein